MWRRKSVSSMRGSASPSTARPLTCEAHRYGARRRSGAASARLLDGLRAELAHQHCGDSLRSRAGRRARRVRRRTPRARRRSHRRNRARSGGPRRRRPPAARSFPLRPPRRRRWRNRHAGARTRGTRSLRPARRQGNDTASISSSSLRAVDIRPVKKSSAATRRCPVLDERMMSPPSARRHSGSSALGSASATEPHTVPRARVCACPTQGSACASSGWRAASSGHASNSACRTDAPTRIASSSTANAAEFFDMHDIEHAPSAAPCASRAAAPASARPRSRRRRRPRRRARRAPRPRSPRAHSRTARASCSLGDQRARAWPASAAGRSRRRRARPRPRWRCTPACSCNCLRRRPWSRAA